MKRWGGHLTLRPDWDAVRVPIMLVLVQDKFGRNPELRARLLATGDALIEEGNGWGYLFWGVALHTNRRRGIKAGQGETGSGRS